MGQNDSRIVQVLGELADLGRRIGERAEELAALAGKRDARSAARRAGRLASSATRLAASAAVGQAAPADSSKKTRRPAPRNGRTIQSPAAATGRHRPRPAGPMLFSTAAHLVVLLALGMIFVVGEAKPERFVIESGVPDEAVLEEFTPLEFESAEDADEAAEFAELPLAEAVAAEMVVPADLAAADELLTLAAEQVMPAAFETGDLLASIGAAGEGEAAGPRGGTGGSGGAAAAGAPTFFGRRGQGQRVCFVCDNSNSYRDGGFHTVLAEVGRAVESLQPAQSFFVIFFSDAAYPMFQPEQLDTLQAATPENKRRLQAWLGTVEMCGGGQGIHDAVARAADLGADVIYFLSDGEHAQSVIEAIVNADLGDTVVHTFGMQQNPFDKRTGAADPAKLLEQQGLNQNLLEIAEAHGGTFTPVVVPPQAAALEQMRPIRKNRSRGPVWGIKL